jgi:hypothetical protein
MCTENIGSILSTYSLCTSSLSLCSLSQREIDRCPFADFSICTDFSFVAANNPFDDGQADSRSLELFFGMEPMEGQKHLIGISGIEPGTVVFDKINGLRVFFCGPELDVCILAQQLRSGV